MVPGYLGGKNSYDVDLLHVGAWVESKSPDCWFREFCGCWCQPLKLKNRRRAGLEEDKSCFRHVELGEPVGHPRRESGVQWYIGFRTGGTNWGNETRVEITLRVCREGSGWWRGWQLTSEEGEWLRAWAPLQHCLGGKSGNTTYRVTMASYRTSYASVSSFIKWRGWWGMAQCLAHGKHLINVITSLPPQLFNSYLSSTSHLVSLPQWSLSGFLWAGQISIL